MSRRAVTAMLALGAICAGGGCGAGSNLTRSMECAQCRWRNVGSCPIYGGVREDVTFLTKYSKMVVSAWKEQPVTAALLAPLGVASILYFALVDLPGSAIVDTELLPLLALLELDRRVCEARREPRPAPPDPAAVPVILETPIPASR